MSSLNMKKESEMGEVATMFTKPAVVRLAHRAGCKRVDGMVYEKIRQNVYDELLTILDQSISNAESHKRKIIKVEDILNAVESERGIRFAYGEGSKKKVTTTFRLDKFPEKRNKN